MDQDARKFINRAPRYVLRPEDEHILRFSREGIKGHTHTTRLLNISMTGLGFLVELELAPQIGELIKVELPMPPDEGIAWWAQVVRIEEYKPAPWQLRRRDDPNLPRVLVGVRFHELPENQEELIKAAIQRKLTQIVQTNRRERLSAIVGFVIDNRRRLIIATVLAALTGALLWWLAQPSENYDPKRGAPWGERYDTRFW